MWRNAGYPGTEEVLLVRLGKQNKEKGRVWCSIFGRPSDDTDAPAWRNGDGPSKSPMVLRQASHNRRRYIRSLLSRPGKRRDSGCVAYPSWTSQASPMPSTYVPWSRRFKGAVVWSRLVNVSARRIEGPSTDKAQLLTWYCMHSIQCWQ